MVCQTACLWIEGFMCVVVRVWYYLGHKFLSSFESWRKQKEWTLHSMKLSLLATKISLSLSLPPSVQGQSQDRDHPHSHHSVHWLPCVSARPVLVSQGKLGPQKPAEKIVQVLKERNAAQPVFNLRRKRQARTKATGGNTSAKSFFRNDLCHSPRAPFLCHEFKLKEVQGICICWSGNLGIQLDFEQGELCRHVLVCFVYLDEVPDHVMWLQSMSSHTNLLSSALYVSIFFSAFVQC